MTSRQGTVLVWTYTAGQLWGTTWDATPDTVDHLRWKGEDRESTRRVFHGRCGEESLQD